MSLLADNSDQTGYAEELTAKATRVKLALAGLTERGLLTSQEADSVVPVLADSRESFDQAICGLALVNEEMLAKVLAEIFEIARLERPADQFDPVHAERLPLSFLQSSRVIPIVSRGKDILVAVVDPTDSTGLRGCEFALQLRAVPVAVMASELELLLHRLEPKTREFEESAVANDFGGDTDRLRDLASVEPSVRLCNRLIREATKVRASDIHIEPAPRNYRIRFRIDGALNDTESLSLKQGLAVISRFKILCNLDIAERRRPQDGRFSLPVGGRQIDLRVSSTPSVNGESIVLRLLQRADVAFDLEALGFARPSMEQLHRLSDRPNGILLLTGPTGSGKTTTLYSLLRRLAERNIKILTIEDPVECQLKGVSQTQVNPSIGLTFASALRSFLRHDPDVIMVGEMRDQETARTAVQAALTGHLVLSTLHTNDSPSAVTRLLDMGIEDYLISSTLIGVCAQRLVRRVCSACSGSTGRHDLAMSPCASCFGVGFHGRIAVAEILEIDSKFRSAIKSGTTASTLKAIAHAAGFIDMVEDGKGKVAAGLTTRTELLKAIAS